MLLATLCSSFVEDAESVVEDVDCCRLLCVLESSSFLEAIESVVDTVDCCMLLCVLESSVLLKLLNLLLKLLIVVGYIICSREL